MNGALTGITVLEFASYVSGPYAGMLLADFGAEVIKIEAPGRGDPFRHWGSEAYSPTFEALNRGKKSITLDLRSEDGRAAAARLAARADVVIDNFRHGVLARLGLDYDRLAAANPRLVHCAITGFGASGPYRDWPGYDTVGQAMSGLLSLLTERDAPQPMGFSFADHLAGTAAFQGIMAALFARERTGKGQKIETSLLEAAIAFIGENACRFFYDGRTPDRARRTHIAQVYVFLDRAGRPFVIHLSSPPKFWEGLLRVVGHPEWQADDRFRNRADRIRNYDALQAELARVFATDDRDAWLERLRAADVPAGPLYDLAEVFADAQVRHLGMRLELDHPTEGKVAMVRNGVRMSATPPEIRSPAPGLGQHNAEILGISDTSGARSAR
ncbi:MAG TPA: CoA transferase [Stellaceae bacterium]|nr:CoA transferase [Stellaceae bacterium]